MKTRLNPKTKYIDGDDEETCYNPVDYPEYFEGIKRWERKYVKGKDY